MYVQPEHYAIVGEYLIGGFKAVLGDALTPEILDAWGAAYRQLADLFINKEKSLYANTEGWTDWQDFRIARKIQESDEITSFYLEPIKESSRPLPPFLPGQVMLDPTRLSRPED
jgi:nitric oxide dioxygenase